MTVHLDRCQKCMTVDLAAVVAKNGGMCGDCAGCCERCGKRSMSVGVFTNVPGYPCTQSVPLCGPCTLDIGEGQDEPCVNGDYGCDCPECRWCDEQEALSEHAA